MPTARIVTRNRESAYPLAQKLQACGYSTIIVSPEDTRSFEPDLEIDLDQYAEGAEGALLTDQELVRFAEQHSAPELGRIVAQDGAWPEDEYQDYVVEREFVLAPMWRAFCSRLEGLWLRLRPEPKPLQEQRAVPEISQEACLEQAQPEVVKLETSSVETQAPASMQAAEITEVISLSTAGQETETISLPTESPSSVASEPELSGISASEEQPRAAEAAPLTETVVTSSSKAEPPAAEVPEHITFQPPSQPPQEPIVVSAALRLESLIEASRDKATEFGIWVKDIDWTWAWRMRDGVMVTVQEGVAETRKALEAASKGLAVARNSLAEVAGKFRMGATPSLPTIGEMRERLQPERSRDRMLATSFVFGALLAGFFLMGWVAAFHVNIGPTHPAMPSAQAQPSRPAAATSPVVPAAAVVVPMESSQPVKEPVALIDSDEAPGPAVNSAHVRHHSALRSDDESVPDVVIRHFDAKPRLKSAGSTASIKRYSDLDDQ